MFGYPVPQDILDERGEPVRYWGARAIFQPNASNPIDLLPDRQQCQDDKDPKPLIDWLNKTGLPELKKMQAFKRLSVSSSEVVEFKEGQFTIRCTPNASHGYLYIGAWQHYPKDCQYELTELPEYVVVEGGDPTVWPKDKIKWANAPCDPPPIGAEVVCGMNGRWQGIVTSYFTEHGFLGFEFEADTRPEYHVKQNPGKKKVLLFGIDLESWTPTK